MPGVPSGRACEGCRRQKKKCDEKQPTCSRCLRLNIPCIGSGQRRFKFQQEYTIPIMVKKGKLKEQCSKDQTSSSSDEERTEVCRVSPHPSNALTVLSQAFVRAIHPSTDIRWNLAWMYGGFLRDVPPRLGTNEALDTAADAVISMHSDFCVTRKLSVQALSKYGRALNTLHTYLDDPVKAASTDTLCAVTILLLCQGFLPGHGKIQSGHAEGAAQILKARKNFRPRDDFEAKLLLTLRGPVLFEGLFVNSIDLSGEEYESLVESDLDAGTPDGQMMRCLARVPGIRERIAATMPGDAGFESLRQEARDLYESYQGVLTALQARTTSVETPLATGSMYRMCTLLHAQYQRMYGLGLTVAIILNCLARALDPDDPVLPVESTYFAQEIVLLSDSQVAFRPLGSFYMLICLLTARVGTTDKILRTTAERALDSYQREFDGRRAAETIAEFEEKVQHLSIFSENVEGNRMIHWESRLLEV
ncbi:hypothetical protein BDV32DRAFT_110916 [Aspergillus pseudonomiae]|uniref:Uncharacterized protein n=1 Tax=Aspergillus pseudonomiae TaxID=1506151 RepID=A0A5N7DQ46_9EURO|nr:uncharacterized protein BDV37DRAFT_173935 [Aspergillus pseudonomiae]KAB8263670.1 hypothetical protein BDV32DRAFT_110916 [Aspergillus pseudonomiae]KAE8408536.1 hypothetical protein BDV37DRAFT_173935 [Aspergillus pseudonomiae]